MNTVDRLYIAFLFLVGIGLLAARGLDPACTTGPGPVERAFFPPCAEVRP